MLFYFYIQNYVNLLFLTTVCHMDLSGMSVAEFFQTKRSEKTSGTF